MASSRVDGRLRILQVNTADVAGGAEKVAWDLFQACRRRGHDSWFAVGTKRSDDPGVVIISNEEHRSRWTQFWREARTRLERGGRGSLSGLARGLAWLGEPRRAFDILRGAEDFHFPGTARLLRCLPACPDVIHVHNLHGWYFDLRQLAHLSRELPVVVTLHDEWLLSGHCAYAFGCERWRTGCGQCPDLRVYPPIRRDATASNWRRKQAIFAQSRLYVATPSRWLMQKTENSILAPAAVERRVIPNGVDLSIFRPGPRQTARGGLGIPEEAMVLLFVAHRFTQESRKGYGTLREAVASASVRLPRQRLVVLAIGDGAATERVGQAEMRLIPYQREARSLAMYYQAADLYVHPAEMDNFPVTVLEALACGLPVVATAVGGVPEQVKSVQVPGEVRGGISCPPGEATGVLTPPGDAASMAEALLALWQDPGLRQQLGLNAAHDAVLRFDVERQADRYLEWYLSILASERLTGRAERSGSDALTAKGAGSPQSRGGILLTSCR